MTAYELVPVAVASAWTCGSVLTLLCSLQKALASRLGLGDGPTRLLLGAFTLTLIPLLPLAGVAVDSFGVEHVLIAGSVATGLALSLLALRNDYGTAVGAVLLLGLAGACMITGATVLMPFTFVTGKPAAAVNLGQFVVGLGAVLTPLLVGTLLATMRWRRTLLLLALVSLAPALAAILTQADTYPVYQRGELEPMLQTPLLWLVALVCFLYLPLENALVLWAGNLPQQGYPRRSAAWHLAGFWIAFGAGRLGMAAWLIRARWSPGKEAWLLLGLGLCLAIALGNLAGAKTRSGTAWGLLLAGLFCGPILPTLLGLLLGRFPEEPGTAVGIVYALGALGSLLTAPLIGWRVQSALVPRALRLPLVASLLMALVSLVLGLTS